MTKILVCTKCKLESEESNFHKRAVNKLRNGRDSWCKPCKSTYRNAYHLLNRESEYVRSREKAWAYVGLDITYDVFLQMLEERKGECELCDAQCGTGLHVDHDHATGKIRGLLCGPCNKGLGQFRDNIKALKNAVNYLSQ